MNQYGVRARNHWRDYLPIAYAELENPEAFFTEMGERIATSVAELSRILAGPDMPGEEYLAKVARLNNAKAQAEEIALAQEGALPQPEETRAEWEDDQGDQIDALLVWTGQMDAQQSGWADYGLSWEATSTEYLLSIDFLKQLVAAPSPLTYLQAHQAELDAATERRWQRHQTQR